MLKYEIFCFWDFYILLSKLQKIIRMLAKYYTFAGVLRMLAKYYTFTGDRFWAILRLLAKYYTFAGVLRMLAKYYTFAGVLRMLAFYVCWRYRAMQTFDGKHCAWTHINSGRQPYSLMIASCQLSWKCTENQSPHSQNFAEVYQYDKTVS